jgi:hypothetical protein
VNNNKTNALQVKPQGMPKPTTSPGLTNKNPDSQHAKPGASAWSPQQRTQEIARVNSDIASKQGKPATPAPAGAVGQMPKIGAKTDGAKKFSIMDRLRSQGSQITNTLGKLGKQMQSKVQGAMKMPGINKSEMDEMIDLLKGQMSKLGKPGLSEKAKADSAQWLASQGKVPAQVQPAPAQAAPAQPSRMQKKPVTAHVDAAHDAAHSQHSHNKLKDNMKRVAKPAEQPKIAPQPTSEQHAVKSPEVQRQFQSKKVIPKEQAPAVQTTGVAPAKPSAKVIPGNSPKAQQAVAAHQKRQFESEKTAAFSQPKDDGWGSPAHQEATQEPTRIAQKPVAGQPKAAAPSDKTVNIKVGQKAAPAQAAPAKPVPAQAAPAKPAAVPAADPKAMEATQIMPRDKHGMPVKELGVKKPFAPEEAHSKLLSFLHNLVSPGSALGRHSQHFMGKSEEVEKKSPTDEKTEKESLASTSVKIQAGAKKEAPKEQAKLLTDEKNYPEHNRKRLRQLIGKQCGDMNKK